jgi:transcriptional regulator with XRE-family HTH domain
MSTTKQGKFLPECLAKLRAASNLNLKSFCLESKINESTYSEIETGHAAPTDEILAKITKFYGTTLEELFDLSDSDPETNYEEFIKVILRKPAKKP